MSPASDGASRDRSADLLLAKPRTNPVVVFSSASQLAPVGLLAEREMPSAGERLRAFVQQGQVLVVDVDLASLATCDLAEDASFLEAADGVVYRRVGEFERPSGRRGLDDDVSRRAVVDTMRCRRATTEAVDRLTIAFDHADDPPCGIRRRFGNLDDAIEKEPQPVLPRAVSTHALQVVVVRLAVALQVQTEIEQRPFQDAVRAQQERDEQAPNPAVAIGLGWKAQKPSGPLCASRYLPVRALEGGGAGLAMRRLRSLSWLHP